MADLTHPEAERAVLAAVLLDGGLLEEVGPAVRDSDWSDRRHRLIYAAMHGARAAGLPIDLRTVQAELERGGTFAEAGGLTYLAGLDMDLPDISRVAAYARLVREAAIRRRLLADLRLGTQRLTSDGAPLGEVVSEVNRALREVDEAVAVDEMHPVGDCFDVVLDALDHPSASGIVGITTGFAELDRMTLGLIGGQLFVVAGRPGMGKTALASCIARAAVDARRPVAFFSLEMGRDELSARLVCAETGIPYSQIRSGHLSSGQAAIVRRAVTMLSGLPLLINDSPHLTPSRLSAMIRKARRDAGAELVIVDYLGLLAADDHQETRNLELASVSRALKVLAKETSLPIVALHQLSRAPEKRSDPRPVLSDLRDSGAIEQDADTVILIHRNPDPLVREAELIVAKQRNGITGSVRVLSRLEAFRFDELHDDRSAQAGLYGGN